MEYFNFRKRPGILYVFAFVFSSCSQDRDTDQAAESLMGPWVLNGRRIRRGFFRETVFTL